MSTRHCNQDRNYGSWDAEHDYDCVLAATYWLYFLHVSLLINLLSAPENKLVTIYTGLKCLRKPLFRRFSNCGCISFLIFVAMLVFYAWSL